jgi:hypothetical protein
LQSLFLKSFEGETMFQFASRRYLIAILTYLLCIPILPPAEAADAEIKTVHMPVISWVSGQDRAGRDAIGDMASNPARYEVFGKLLQSLVRRDEASALRLGSEGRFRITTIIQNQTSFLAVTDARHPDQGPTIILNLDPKIDLIAGAPHPSNERGTYQQAILLVTEKGARAAIIAGAHRCASRTYVTCDGKTRTCGAREAYRTSDSAHSPATLFHVAHQVLTSAWPQAVVLSLHGMRTDDKGVKTSVVLSNGIRGPDDAKSTAASRLRKKLASALPDDGAVVSCNIPEDKIYKFRRLCGTTNVQGRLVNGDNDVCHRSVTHGTGRFIHLEQDRRVRDPFALNWRDIKGEPFMQRYLDAIVAVAPSIK